MSNNDYSTNDENNWVAPGKKKKLDPSLSHDININSRLREDLNMKNTSKEKTCF